MERGCGFEDEMMGSLWLPKKREDGGAECGGMARS